MKLSSACDGSRGSSDAIQERVKTLEASFVAKDKAISELEALPMERQRMVSSIETMLGARNTENTAQVALISRIQSGLDDHKKKLKESLDGQQAIKEEYVDLSFELTYEFQLRNP
uniref:Uncharacterized protein n=1 Tax=Cannabis sativa TaxID=3483 RepID=A0A803NHH5_CANSA